MTNSWNSPIAWLKFTPLSMNLISSLTELTVSSGISWRSRRRQWNVHYLSRNTLGMDLQVWADKVPCSSLIIPSGRLFRQTWSNTNETIEHLISALKDLKESFDRGVACQAIFISGTLLEKVETLGTLRICACGATKYIHPFSPI